MNKWIPYQIGTTLAKKVGGPINLALLLQLSGVGIYKLIEYSVKSLHKKQTTLIPEDEIITVKMSGITNDNLRFNIGDKYKILVRTAEGCLIEKLGDSDNPYFVSNEFLNSIS